jgi:hypothetical protein
MSEQLSPAPRTIKVPGPEHPITIERNPNRVVVTVASRVVADTRNAREAGYPAVHYVPRKDAERFSSARNTPPTVLIRETAPISAFHSTEIVPRTPCGPTRRRTRR